MGFIQTWHSGNELVDHDPRISLGWHCLLCSGRLPFEQMLRLDTCNLLDIRSKIVLGFCVEAGSWIQMGNVFIAPKNKAKLNVKGQNEDLA